MGKLWKWKCGHSWTDYHYEGFTFATNKDALHDRKTRIFKRKCKWCGREERKYEVPRW